MESKELVPYQDIERMAVAVCKSGLFGIKNVEAAISLMLLCQSEGLHPIQAVRRFDVLPNGKVSMKAEAMLAEFQARGGKVEWHQISDEQVVATFDAPGLTVPVAVKWTVGDAKRAGLLTKDNWQKYPRQMLRARVITDGVKMALPAAGLGLYPTEVAQDFEKDDLSLSLEASIAQAKEKKTLGEWARKIEDGSVIVKGGSESIPPETSQVAGPPIEEEPPIDNEPPAVFADSGLTPEEERALIASAGDGQPLFGDDDKHEEWLREKGLGQKCVKCDGTMEKYRSERTGRIYLQCNKAHSLREDALKEGCDAKTAKAFTRGHSYAYL